MPRNEVQLQNDLSGNHLDEVCETEKLCHDALVRLRRDQRLSKSAQTNDANIGGVRSGKGHHGNGAKTHFVANLSTTGDGKPDQISLRHVIGFWEVAITELADGAEL